MPDRSARDLKFKHLDPLQCGAHHSWQFCIHLLQHTKFLYCGLFFKKVTFHLSYTYKINFSHKFMYVQI
jgi:hypothetical protein